MKRARKALAAAGTAFVTTLAASLWQAAAGSGVTSDEVAGSIGLAVAAAVAGGLAVYGVRNDGFVDLSALTIGQRAEVSRVLAVGPKPASVDGDPGPPPAGPTAGGGRFA